MVRDTVRRFVSDRVLPDIATWSDQGVFPNELAKEMEAGDSGFRSFVSVQGSLAMFPIWAYGSEQHKQQWLPGMAAGEPIGCFGLSEHDSGSDPSSMTTNARRDGDDWILNGAKMWITNGSVADVAIVWARDTTDDRVRGFVVPTDTPGFTTNDVKQKLSLRVSVTSELVLQDVRLPADAVLPGVDGMRGPLSCLNEARYGILWGAAGAARACYESALDDALERPQFGQPIAGFQLTQRKLVEMMVAVNKATMLALHLGPWPTQGRWQAHTPTREFRQARRRPCRAGDRSHGQERARSQRHHGRVSCHASRRQPRIGVHLRGNP